MVADPSQDEYDQLLESKLEVLLNCSENTGFGAEISYDLPMASNPSSPTATTQIGAYHATYHASGASSTVYKAYDDHVGTPIDNSNKYLVALKVTRPSWTQAPHDPKREARILNVAKHGSVVRLLATFSIQVSTNRLPTL